MYNKKTENSHSSRNYCVTDLVGKPLNYLQAENWMFLDKNPRQKVDLFFFYSTVSMTVSQKGSVISDNTNETKKIAQSCFEITASAFSSYTNVFAPYYRQIPMEIALQTPTIEDYEKLLHTTEVRTDAYAALDTYFKNYNQRRPFILAGHSQGSGILKMILSDYMKAHPDYLKRMVAAYVIGFPISQDWLNQTPYLKFAEKEDDTGVIISWNTEGPHPTKKNFVQQDGSIAINPINWKRDETPAFVSENKGTLVSKKPMTIALGVADATLNLKRGTVVCSTSTNFIPKKYHNFFGDQSFHMHDYDFYYANIKENGQKRINAYFKIES